MAVKRIMAVVEASSTGFGVYSERVPGITGYGKTVERAKANFLSALQETKQAYGRKVPKELKGEFDFVYKYDIASIFEHFGMLDASSFAKKIGMNPSLLRQYKTGHALASDKQKKRIEVGLRELGRQLMNVRL
jgi:predicted RNase H-like HicB family nuclease